MALRNYPLLPKLRFTESLLVRVTKPTLSHVEWVVNNGNYYSRADFIRAAIREKLDKEFLESETNASTKA